MFSVSDARRGLSEDGYIEWKDSDIGEVVSQLEDRRFAFLSRWGLNYCKDHVFNDTVRHLSALFSSPFTSSNVY